jgi:EAL and modified HD-GYP domain-containing signal transduction protein
MIGRLLTWWRAPPPSAPPPRSLARPAPARPAVLPASAQNQTALGSPGWLVARRPLIDRSGAIAGWDLQMTERAAERLARRDTPRVLREAYWFALAQAAREANEASRKVLVGAPAAALLDPGFLDRLPAGAMVRVAAEALLELEVDAPGWNAALRSRRVLLAAPPPVDAEFLLVDASAAAGAAWRDSLQRAGRAKIATNLASYEDVGAAVRLGVDFCCGNFAVAARRPEQRNVAAPAIRAAHVLSAVIGGEPPREVADRFKADPALAHRLLRATRSAAFALNRPLESILEAVMMLGTRELYRWLSVLLMSADRSSAIAPALHETALTRGRLLELLAETAGRSDPPEQLFVTGSFSLLDLLLNVPLDVALALTPLPTAATEALIGETGPWRPYLAIALALENDAPEKLQAACRLLQVPVETTLELAAQARQWAAETVAQLQFDGLPERQAATA